MHDFDSSTWREPEGCTELHITGFWSAIHTQSHYFLLLTAQTALNTWTIKTSWFPLTAEKVMSMGNLSLAPLKPAALPSRWPEEFEWVCWAVAMLWFGQIHTRKKTLFTHRRTSREVYADDSSLTWLKGVVTWQVFRENPHFSVWKLVRRVNHHMVTINSEQALPLPSLGSAENESANNLSILSTPLNRWSKKWWHFCFAQYSRGQLNTLRWSFWQVGKLFLLKLPMMKLAAVVNNVWIPNPLQMQMHTSSPL